MLRHTVSRLVRRKHSQRVWSPNASSSGAAPTTGITAQEALQIAYRPMPPAQTVEYEEDFGHNMIIHRECVVQRNRDRMIFDIAPLAYSDTELHKAQQQLARHMNCERQSGALSTGSAESTEAVNSSGSSSDHVHLNVDVDDETRTVRSARYLFDAARLQYCSRFQDFFHDYVEREEQTAYANQGGGTEYETSDDHDRTSRSLQTGDLSNSSKSTDTHILFSLMEACAILYGCSTPNAQEMYYRAFLNLDLDSLEDDAAKQRDLITDTLAVQDELSAQYARSVGSNQDDVIMRGEEQSVVSLMDSIPCLFDSDNDKGDFGTSTHGNEKQRSYGTSSATAHHIDNATHSAPVSSSFSEINHVQATQLRRDDHTYNEADHDTNAEHTSSDQESSAKVALNNSEFGPLYKAYIAHSKGDSPVASYDISSIGSVVDLIERRRWRSIMERLVREEYHTFTRADWHEAAALNSQLHTIKFYDLKIGDTVREILLLMQRESGHGSSVHSGAPLRASPTHPQNRASNTTGLS